MVSGKSSVTNDGRTVHTARGDCKTSKIIYSATCILCSEFNVYIGKTVSELRTRFNNHRTKFYEILYRIADDPNFLPNFLSYLSEIEDEQILGAHLVARHKLYNRIDFNKTYKLDVVAHCKPNNLQITEQYYIDKLNTLAPFGLNQINAIGGN